jgi:hypothetical protein
MQGDVIVGGYFGGVIDFGGGPITAMGSNGFVAKLSSSSGAPIWSKGILGMGQKEVTSVATDSEGNVFISGAFSEGTLSLDGWLLELGATSEAAFAAKLDPAGKVLWLTRLEANATASSSQAIAADSEGGVLVVGYFNGTADFGGASGSVTSVGGTDIFLAKLSSQASF